MNFTIKSNLDHRTTGQVHEKKKPYGCTICPSKFGRKSNMNQHVSFVHERKKSQYPSLPKVHVIFAQSNVRQGKALIALGT